MDGEWEEMTPQQKHEALYMAVILHLKRLPPADRLLPHKGMTREERIRWFVEAVEKHLANVKFIRPKGEQGLCEDFSYIGKGHSG